MSGASALDALTEALHDTDETCNAHHYMPLEECATKEWDREHDLYLLEKLLTLVQPDFEPTTWMAFRRFAVIP